MARLTLENLSKSFPGRDGRATWAVRDLNLEIPDGQLLVLLGPSGCGKTTTLRLIAGLEQPQAGRILLDGQPITQLPPEQRDVAMVFQSRALFPHLTVRENLAIGLKLRRLEAAEISRRVSTAAARLGLGTLLDRLPQTLSGGEQQRAALGRALVRQPRVFLLDEPLSQLDLRLREQLRSEIQQLQQSLGTTMVYVTHDQFEAMALGQSVAVIRDGLLQQVGPPRSLYDQPANLFVARFIGWPPMNLFQAKLESQNGNLFIRLEDSMATFRVPLPENGDIQLSLLLNRPLWVGVRPENLHWSPVAQNNGAGTTAQLAQAVESPTARPFVQIKLGPLLLTACSPTSTSHQFGQHCQLATDFASIRLFDPQTERGV